jgi:hypothetical protein
MPLPAELRADRFRWLTIDRNSLPDFEIDQSPNPVP